MIRVVFGRLQNHASLVISLEAGLVPVGEVLVFFGVRTQRAILGFVVEVRAVDANVLVLRDLRCL